MKIKAVVFDVDGTLLDTVDHVIQAFEHVMIQHGEQPDRQRIIDTLGPTLIECYEILLPNHNADVAADLHHKIQQTPALLELVKEYEGLREALDALKASGVRCAVFTNRWRKGLDLLFGRTDLQKEFDVIITPESVTKGKPDPEGLFLIAEALKLQTGELAMVGDTLADIGAGKNARAGAVVGITHGFGTREQLEAAGADYVIDGLHELVPVLERLSNED